MFNTLNFRQCQQECQWNGDFFAVKNITQSLKGGFCLCLTQLSLKTGEMHPQVYICFTYVNCKPSTLFKL